MKAKKEAFELERDCKSKTSNIQKMVRQLKMLEQQVQDIREQHAKNTQVLQVILFSVYCSRSLLYIYANTFFYLILFKFQLVSFFQ